MKLTAPQCAALERLRRATSIHYGVRWYYIYLSRDGTRRHMEWLKGNVCNALVRKGVLIPVAGSLTEHTLNTEYTLNTEGVSNAMDDQRAAPFGRTR